MATPCRRLTGTCLAMRPALPDPQSMSTAASACRSRYAEHAPPGLGAAGPAPRIVTVRGAIPGCLMLADEASRAISGLVPLHQRRALAVVARGHAVPLPHVRRAARSRA